MKIQESLTKYSHIEIELLLQHVLKKPKEFLFLHPQFILSSYHLNILSKLVERRETGEPIAYILGYKDFFGLRFKVSPDVLVPRPETEDIVHKVLQVCKVYKVSAPLKILDVGTGSGAIAVSLAKNLKANSYKLTASDLSKKALTIAKLNGEKHKVKIKFIQSDLFENISGKFDIIVANLPYIPFKMLRKHLLNKTKLGNENPFKGLQFEPAFALTDGGSIWRIYKRFFEQVSAHLNPNAVIYLEIDPASRKFLADYQKKYLPQGEMKFFKDFRNLWRFAEIKIK